MNPRSRLRNPTSRRKMRNPTSRRRMEPAMTPRSWLRNLWRSRRHNKWGGMLLYILFCKTRKHTASPPHARQSPAPTLTPSIPRSGSGPHRGGPAVVTIVCGFGSSASALDLQQYTIRLSTRYHPPPLPQIVLSMGAMPVFGLGVHIDIFALLASSIFESITSTSIQVDNAYFVLQKIKLTTGVSMSICILHTNTQASQHARLICSPGSEETTS